jgi:hypothetical protein
MAESAITFTPGEVSTYYSARFPHLKQRRASEWRGPCAIHRGEDGNFAVDPATGLWYCHSQCSRGGDLLDFEMAMTGADFKTALAAVYAIVGRAMPERARMTREEWRRAQEAHEREEEERSAAAHFAAAAALLAEGVLEALEPFDEERAVQTRLIESLRRDPRAVYRDWREHNPEMAAALVLAGREHERRVHLRLAELILEMPPNEANDAA